MTSFRNIRTALKKRAEYHRTKQELSDMPLYVAHDLGLFPEDAAKVAAKAVYG